MSYHNLRDKNGRFTRKKREYKRRHAKVRNPKEVAKDITVLNVYLLDDSSSMSFKAQATANGFNEVLQSAINDTKTTGVPSKDLLCVFGTPDNFVWKNEVKLFGPDNKYQPNQSSTALYDAIVYTINRTVEELRMIAGKTKVVLTIFTDGENNSSRHNDIYSVRRLVEEKKALGWVINFVGAGAKDFVERAATSMGIYATNTLAYTDSVAGTSKAFASMSAANTSYRVAVASGSATTDGYFSED